MAINNEVSLIVRRSELLSLVEMTEEEWTLLMCELPTAGLTKEELQTNLWITNDAPAQGPLARRGHVLPPKGISPRRPVTTI